jgi:hypothetical protein
MAPEAIKRLDEKIFRPTSECTKRSTMKFVNEIISLCSQIACSLEWLGQRIYPLASAHTSMWRNAPGGEFIVAQRARSDSFFQRLHNRGIEPSKQQNS